MDKYLFNRLREAYPETADPSVLSAINVGIALADDAISGLPFLRTVIGRDIRGFLRRAGVMHAIQEFARRGDLPFEVNFEKQTRGNWHWAVLNAAGVEGHIVKTPSYDGFPQDAPTRTDKRLSNNGDLFDAPKLVPIEKLVEPDSKIYAWLGYGVTHKGVVTHATWGIPAYDCDVYLAQADIMKTAEEKALTKPPSTQPTPEVKLTFKQHIQDYIDSSDDIDKAE